MIFALHTDKKAKLWSDYDSTKDTPWLALTGGPWGAFSEFFGEQIPQDTHRYFETFCWFVLHDDVIKWKHFPRYWSFVRGIHRWPVNSPHKGQWRGALMFSLISWFIWVNIREAGDLRRRRAHYDAAVMKMHQWPLNSMACHLSYNIYILPNYILNDYNRRNNILFDKIIHKSHQ